jgi:putative effector of murein hydrolase
MLPFLLVTAGIVSTTAVYLLAIGSQELFSTCARNFPLHRRCEQLDDEEAARSCKNERHSVRLLSVICAKLPASTSDVSTVGSIRDAARHTNRDGAELSTEVRESSTPTDPCKKPWAMGIVCWVLDHPLLVSTWFFTLAICIPIRYGTGLEEPLGVSLLLTIWATVLALQTGIKTSNIRPLRLMPPKLRTALSVASNPVLWTALGLIAYASAEGHRTGRPITEMLATLEQNTTFTDLLMHRAAPVSRVYIDFRLPGNTTATTTVPAQQQSPADYAHRPPPNIAAGDVANAILSAGLVCWGLKLWEYRRRLLSSAGFTILLVSCIAALGNVVLGPLLAREILGPHSEPGYDLAFVARSVTLALGAPAIAKLGGDMGLNAAMVVVNGIMCQMLLGLGVGEWLGRRADVLRDKVGRWRVEASSEDDSGTTALHKDDREKSHGNRRKHSRGVHESVVLDPPPTQRDHLPPNHLPGPSSTRSEPSASNMPPNPPVPTTDTSTIASGVTVGINAAAMGTAHLYEAGSEAAPYSALAMTVFGVATVGFTMIPQLGGWVAGIVGQV